MSSFVLVQGLTEYETFIVVCKNPRWARIQEGKAANVHVERQGPSSEFVDMCDVKSAARCERVCVGVWLSLDGEGHVRHRRAPPQTPAAALSVCLPA